MFLVTSENTFWQCGFPARNKNGASAIAVGAAAAIRFTFFKGPSEGGDDGLPLDDAPNHVK